MFLNKISVRNKCCARAGANGETFVSATMCSRNNVSSFARALRPGSNAPNFTSAESNANEGKQKVFSFAFDSAHVKYGVSVRISENFDLFCSFSDRCSVYIFALQF